ncbi:MAG: NADH-quinone oxidoreductase subunit N [Candidatus Xenobia bacterium]
MFSPVASISIELVLALAGILTLVLEMIGGVERRNLAWLALGGLLAAALVGLWTEVPIAMGDQTSFFGGALIVDRLALYFKYISLVVTALSILISIQYVEQESRYPGEFYSLVVFICLGMVLVASVGDLITLFVSLELISMPLYALAAYLKNDKRSSEAGLKFFLIGAVSSAFYLFGASLLWGLTGSTHLADFAASITTQGTSFALVTATVCIVAAFGFKIAVAPFHMWAPDVYQGSPTPVTAFLSTGPKAAGLVLIARFFLQGMTGNPPGLFRDQWVLLIMVLSLLSMVVGNLVAIPQSNIKRMMAFSGISHLGYMLIGIAAAGRAMGTDDAATGLSATLFYIFLYTLTTLGAWAVIILVGLATNSEEIRDFAGLSRRSPMLAFVLFIGMLSLAGAPPLSGFIGKFYLFTAAWEQHLYPLVIVGILASVTSLYYYLGVLRQAYFEPPATSEPIAVAAAYKPALVLCSIAILVVGLIPQFTQWTVGVARAFLPHL